MIRFPSVNLKIKYSPQEDRYWLNVKIRREINLKAETLALVALVSMKTRCLNLDDIPYNIQY